MLKSPCFSLFIIISFPNDNLKQKDMDTLINAITPELQEKIDNYLESMIYTICSIEQFSITTQYYKSISIILPVHYLHPTHLPFSKKKETNEERLSP